MGQTRFQTAHNKIASGKGWYGFLAQYLFPLVLLLYPLRHIFFGVEWWDTGYNYANFVFMDKVDPMWLFSTYLGNAMGNFFTKLPFGNTMIGLNVYTGLVTSLLALMGYYFFTWKDRVPHWIVFLGELLAVSLCWCPTALLYNYLTYLCLGAGTILLYFALIKERWWLFAGAGLVLGINLFVRFSNLAEVSLIVGVWAYGIIKRRKIGKVLSQTMWCILGYLGAVAAGLGYMALKYGLDTYISGITRLLSMPSEADDYSVYSMIYGQVIFYKQNFLWLRTILLVVVLGILLFTVVPAGFGWLRRLGGKHRPAKDAAGSLKVDGSGSATVTPVHGWVLKGVWLICIAACFYYLYRKGMFNFDYTTTRSMFEWAVFLLVASLAAGTVVIFSKKARDEDKLQAGLSMLLILVTPLGSNNHLFSSINNLFLVAPFTIWLVWRFLNWIPGEISIGKRENSPAFSTFPIKSMIIGIAVMLFVQVIGCGAIYVFTESKGGKNLNTKLENNDILRGMYTSPDRAQVISQITEYVKESGLEGKSVILYGQIPAMSYYLNMPFAITAWPDLRSYNYDVMEQDLKELSGSIQDKGEEQPVVLMEIKYGTYLTGGSQALKALDIEPQEIEKVESDKKLTLLKEWMGHYSYRPVFENEKFMLFESE